MSSQFITNQNNLLSEVVKNILPYSDKLYFLVGYFYFSGFETIYKELEDKELKILVGLEIEKDLLNRVKEIQWLNQPSQISRQDVRKKFNNAFVDFFNETDFFDTHERQQAFKLFIKKIKNGSLEIRKTLKPNHAKLYLFQRKEEFTEKNTYPGTLITGSSNLTFSGMQNQYELNVILRSPTDFNEAKRIFDELWNESIVIVDSQHIKEFEEQVIEKIWFEKVYSPFLIYVRVLHELFQMDDSKNLKFPYEITRRRYFNLKYQTDAIRQAISIIDNHHGVIIADVVGLGKSIIASTIAHNIGLKTIVIAPPHLCYQWEYEYKEYFNLQARVFSSGSIEKAVEYYEKIANKEKCLIIIDEAHKYRNENTQDYLNLHRLCQGNYVILLTATPYNNRPQDIYALIKLFQIPSKTTLTTVSNLGYEFESLISQYKQLENQRRKNKRTDTSTKKEAEKIAKKIRDIIYPLVIRRSRIDLEEIEEYKKDIQQQKISFPRVHDPILLDYSLGSLEKLYVKTLEKISSEDKRNCFKGTRYKPVVYVKNFEKYKKNIEEQFGEFHLFKEAQQNLSQFMRHLLVRRFESSMFAFRTTLEYMIRSSENILKWMEHRKAVPIFKQGYLPDIDDFYDTTIDNTSLIFNELAFDEVIEKLQNKGLFEIPENEISVEFKNDLEHDIKILKTIYNEWFEQQQWDDPKLLSFKAIINEMLQQEPNRKIVVFSEFSDTVNYLYENLKSEFRVFKFTSADANDKNRRIIQLNFDAGVPDEQQQNDYDILVATDAISEGYNLHRAGAIFNYDIPYNPTRVIQRVGRINRINRKVFDELYIYNYFPTETGEKETQTRQISTLKMAMIHALLGEDTRILTSDEELQAFFKERYKAELEKFEERSWENQYLNFYKSLPQQVIEEALKIPSRVRIQRTDSKNCQGVLVFGKKGENAIFRLGESPIKDKNLTAQEALLLLEAEHTENATTVSETFEEIYQFVKRNLFQQLLMVKQDKKKNDAINKISLAIQLKHTTNVDYFNDLLKVIQANALPAIYLKTINKTKISEIDKIMTLIPYSYLETILAQIKEIEESTETIIVAEQFV